MFVHNLIVMFEKECDAGQVFVELLVKRVEAPVDGVEAFVDRVEALVNGTEPSIDGVEAGVHPFFEACDGHASTAVADHSIVEMRRRCRAVEV